MEFAPAHARIQSFPYSLGVAGEWHSPQPTLELQSHYNSPWRGWGKKFAPVHARTPTLPRPPLAWLGNVIRQPSLGPKTFPNPLGVAGEWYSPQPTLGPQDYCNPLWRDIATALEGETL